MKSYWLIERIAGSEGEPRYDTTWFGTIPYLTDDAETAAIWRRAHKIREVGPDDWRLVQAARMWDTPYIKAAERYTTIEHWMDKWWFRSKREVMLNHWPHVAKGDPAKVAYTESDEKGRRDIQTVVKPGRFLTKFFSDVLTPEQIAQLANEYVALTHPGELLFATDPNHIEKVYTSGPSSCMSYGAGHFSSPVHPARVYASPDLAVAHIKKPDGRITARAVVWPEKKVWSRIYGDRHRLETALIEQGYTNGTLEGARIARIEDDDGDFVCPYIDGIGYVSDRGDYLVITEDGEIEAQNTNGYACGSRYVCSCCGDGVRRGDDLTYVYGSGDLCESCLENHAVYSEVQGEWFNANDATELADGTWVSDRYFDYHGWTCDATGQRFLSDDGRHYMSTISQYWCQAYFDQHGFYCPLTHENYPNTEGVDHPEHGMIHRDTEAARALLSETAEAA